MINAPRGVVLLSPHELAPRLLAALLAAAVLGLAVTAKAAETARYRVAFAQDTLANDWRAAQVQQLAQAFARFPAIEFSYSDAKGRTAKQISDIEDFIAQGIDVLIASPRDGIAMAPVIARAHRMGIPVILLTRRVEGEEYASFIGPDDRAIATRAARYMANAMEERGRVLMLQGVPTTTTAKDRSRAFREEMRRHPRIEVKEKTANYLRADAIRAVEEALAEGPFDAIFAQSDSMAEGAVMALRKAGVDPGNLLIVGIDYIGRAREAIRQGEQDASFTYPTCAKEAVEVTLAILEGRKPPREVVPDSVMVTRDNVNAVEPIF